MDGISLSLSLIVAVPYSSSQRSVARFQFKSPVTMGLRSPTAPSLEEYKAAVKHLSPSVVYLERHQERDGKGLCFSFVNSGLPAETYFLFLSSPNKQGVSSPLSRPDFEDSIQPIREKTQSPSPRVGAFNVDLWKQRIGLGIITKTPEDLEIPHAFSKILKMEEDKDKELQSRLTPAANNFPTLTMEEENFVGFHSRLFRQSGCRFLSNFR